jgi:phosphatidylinositol dimannoside acyltransferase
VTLWYEEGLTCFRIHPPLRPPDTGTRAEKVAAMTQACADLFAGGIAQHPQDWHMMQRLWVADVPARNGGGQP